MRQNAMRAAFGAAVVSVMLAGPAAWAQGDAQTGSGNSDNAGPTAPEPAEVATDSREQAARQDTGRTPIDLWRSWLDEKGLTEGVNQTGQDRTFFIASGKAQVRGDFGSKTWVDARQTAFNAALLQAKSEMANTVGSVLRSDRAFEVVQQGGDAAPPDLKQVRDQISTIERMQKLTNEALDAKIRKYDPDWQGKGSEEARKRKLVQIQERYQEKVASGARLLINGAMPIFNAEGDNADQRYTVLVGIVWSPRTAALAESIYNKQVKIPKGPEAAPIVDQIERKLADNPNFLAVSQGARIWNKADGTKVIVSFAPVYRSRSSMMNEQKAALIGRSQIAQFVAERVASRQMSDSSNTFRAYADGSAKAFNNSEFRSLIRAKAKQVEIKGATRVYSWKGQHPAANVPMQTDVYMWSPESRQMAVKLQDLAEEAGPGADASNGGQDEAGADGNLASPSRSGAGSNVSNY